MSQCFRRQFMNFLRKRCQIPPFPWGRLWAREKHAAGLPVLGQRFFKQNSKWRTKTPVSQVKKVILGKHKLVSIKDKFYMLLATLQLNLYEKQFRSLDNSNNNFIGSYRTIFTRFIILILMRSIYSYIFCLEILLLLYNLHMFASDQINEESNNKKMFFSNF